MTQERSARAINRREKKQDACVTYGTDREGGVGEIFIISLLSVWSWFGNDLYSRGYGFKFVTHVENKTSQFEIIVKSLACFNTQRKVK